MNLPGYVHVNLRVLFITIESLIRCRCMYDVVNGVSPTFAMNIVLYCLKEYHWPESGALHLFSISSSVIFSCTGVYIHYETASEGHCMTDALHSTRAYTRTLGSRQKVYNAAKQLPDQDTLTGAY